MNNALASSSKFKKFVELLYSFKSELNHIQDLELRKKRACELSGLPWNAEATQKIVNLEDQPAVDVIIDYLQRENPYEYSQLIASQEALFKIQRRMMLGEELSTATHKYSKQLLQDVKQLYRDIYKEEKLVEVAQAQTRRKSLEQRIKESK
jgi:hypothetical protein